MKYFAIILFAIITLTSCDDQKKFKYHVVGSNIKYVGSFDNGLIVGDTTIAAINGFNKQVVLDSVIPEN